MFFLSSFLSFSIGAFLPPSIFHCFPFHCRPDDPREFLLEKLVQFQENRGVLPFFTETDATAMFGMFDRANSGFITEVQFKQALKCLDIKASQEVSGPVSLQQFLRLTEEATRQ